LVSILFAGLASTALAQTTSAKQTSHAQLVETLKSAQRLLVSANHDYDGHRAKAAQEVHNALKGLSYHHHKKVQSGVTPNNGTAIPPKAAQASQQKVHEPQATSDAQLREAQQLLQGALTQLNGNHPKTATNVKAAIAEINMALAIK
jgi:hypothetical protein